MDSSCTVFDGIDIPLGEEVEVSSTKLVQEEPPLLDGLTLNPVSDVKVRGTRDDIEVYAITCKNGEIPDEIRFVVPQTDYNLDPENVVKDKDLRTWAEMRTKPIVSIEIFFTEPLNLTLQQYT